MTLISRVAPSSPPLVAPGHGADALKSLGSSLYLLPPAQIPCRAAPGAACSLGLCRSASRMGMMMTFYRVRYRPQVGGVSGTHIEVGRL